jgi:hypothetical protein
MKKLLLLFAVLGMMITPYYLKANDDKKSDDDILRKSQMFEPPNFAPDASSFPMPFQEIGNPVTRPAISTGYYFVDSDDQAPDYWRPSPSIIDTTTDPNLWRRILPGPRLRDPADWVDNPDGLRFFRNPALPLPGGDFFNGPTDSTDDAIAGPMPIGFNFYFNGLKYDSFYVSTNGIIALTNDRYFYDSQKNRIIPPGATTCYNPMSMDWFYAGRGHNGDGLNDPINDDFGYYYSVCGGNPMNARGGIRARGGTLNQGQFAANKSALIAPFFGDLHLSNYNTVTNQPEDWGKVFFKRSNNSDKLLIYFINVAPVRLLATPYGPYNGNFNLRPGDQNYIAASAQVILDKRDSSVMIVYERFDGVAVVNGRGVPAPTIFRYNTTVGVHGFARHTNYGQPGGEIKPWAGEYEQYTHYFSRYGNPNVPWPHNYLAIRFKQWKNTLRVVDIAYRVRKSDPNADLEFTEEVPTSKVNNYELLAGDERNGAIQPVAIIQNLTNEIQGPSGVNYQRQELNFRARFRIINEASLRIVYNRLVPIDSTCLALKDSNAADCTGDPYTREKYVNVTVNSGNYKATELPFPGPNGYNGIPPYGFVQVFFPPFEPNEYVNNHIGRMRAFIIADPTHPRTNEKLGDTWPFDDTASVRLFVMKRLDDFNDDVTSYHIVNRAPMPSTLKWVNIDAEVASGDDVSKYPLPPRGTYPPTNNFDFNFTTPDFTRDTRESPVIRMTRKTLAGTEPAKSPGGDQLRSFPIDLRGRFGAVLSLSIQRTAKRDDWPRGWSDQELVGPEPRTLVNADPFTVFSARGRAASAPPDELTVEFARPSPDGIRYVTNIDDKRWRHHPRRDGAKPVTNMPVLSVYGAGGYMVGWLESDRDSALSRPSRPNLNGLRPDIFDDGIDFEYKKFFLAIPDTFIKSENEGAKNFRFRLNMQARNNKKCIACIPDDDDAYFVDNVKILFPSEVTDIELSLVKILWPYTIAPASQAIKVPVRVKISNNTNIAAPPFRVKVKIWRRGDYDLQHAIYCRTVNIPVMTGRTSVEIPLPNWNARKTGPGEYLMLANLLFGEPNNPDFDLEPLNDTNFTMVKLDFGDVFAYDPAQNPRNDVPDNAFTGIPGRGLNIFGFAYGGRGNINGPVGGYDENNYGAGYVGGSGSGQIAMKFTLNQRDTVYGYNAFFGPLNQAFDDISLAIYRDANGPSMMVQNSLVYKFRGFDDIRRDAFWDEYVTYLLPQPLVLDAGTYWMAIGQLGETGLELGASKTRVGMRITSVYIPPPVFMTSPVGGSGYHLVIDKDFRRFNNTGNLINDNKFALENSRGSGQWAQFMPTIGNPAYAHLHHFGTSPADGYTLTLSRGTWIPMIRPYFGERSYGSDMGYYPCADDIPVELTYFDGIPRNSSIELFWETATEVNNEGFYVEKRNKGEETWNSIGFIKGAGNSKSVQQYTFTDKNVQPNIAYQYRLRQVDKDGSMSCESFSKIVTLVFEGQTELALYQNVPNPVSNHTAISFTLSQESNVRLEVVDVFGNVVKTLVNSNVNAGNSTVEWNALDNNNRPVPSGSYIVRLVAGNDVRTMKMTVVR